MGERTFFFSVRTLVTTMSIILQTVDEVELHVLGCRLTY